MTELPADIEDAIRTFATAQEIGREEALERILRDWLSAHRYLPAEKDDGTRPEDLNASNDD